MSAARINVHSVLGIEAMTGADYRLSLSLQMTDWQKQETIKELLGSMPSDKLADFLRDEFAELFGDAPVAQPAAWQERHQKTRAEWTGWYDCDGFPKSATHIDGVWSADIGGIAYQWRPLYTAPPAAARVPLTDEQIDDMWANERRISGNRSLQRQWLRFARAIERAHGIAAASQEGGAA